MSGGHAAGLWDKELSLESFNLRFTQLQLLAGRTDAQLRTARDFRSGRRTQLAYAHVPDAMVMLMGRWKTIEACTGYLRPSAALLRVLDRHMRDK